MGLRISDLPAIGNLPPQECRALARWLRDTIPRGQTLADEAFTTALRASSFGAEASIDRLLEVDWLQRIGGELSADMYPRRLAAAAVEGARMSVDEAHALALQVRERISLRGGAMGGVMISHVVLYGSALRDEGNAQEDVGDLDLAVHLVIRDPELQARVNKYPAAQRWRAALRLSGWEHTLMAGDDRVTVAGSLAAVLFKVNQQLHKVPESLTTEADQRTPVLMPIWGPLPVTKAMPLWWRCAPGVGDLDALPEAYWQTLALATAWTLLTQKRAVLLDQRLPRFSLENVK